MNAQDCRNEIDKIDEQIVKLFSERMELSAEIAKYKKENNLPILNPKREREVIQSVMTKSPESLRDYSATLYSMIFELSRSYQNRLNGTSTDLTKKIEKALESTPKLFPEYESVACQGTDGSNSQFACDISCTSQDLSPCLQLSRTGCANTALSRSKTAPQARLTPYMT